ncbi:ATPase, T2SS/T4P/T4SS family [Natronosalvus rutilus]|uniref:Flp pilus assembly complex ATPase component TadA n=1 Tax=Natronosalvus rutilus TaxID=2953753 RepID=A0A9E7N9S1_9EURY|nr:ATPase, T2SS/T4P/T4SS family [Natronosalvus rutilus]UTF54060.1 Flp pilus assembly complex ATPase component TadA [Natronosalvus rutilus]
MATEDVDQTDPGAVTEGGDSGSASGSDTQTTHEPTRGADVRVGAYTWADFMTEYGYEDEISILYPHGVSGPDDQLGLDTDGSTESTAPYGADWERIEFDPEAHLGYDPDELPDLIGEVFQPNGDRLQDIFLTYVDPETTPVLKDFYTWEHYKWEYYYDEDGSRPRDGSGEIESFDEEEALGFDPDDIRRKLHQGGQAAMELDDVIEERTVNVSEDLDEDKFFSTEIGDTTVVNRYDLEKAVPFAKKRHYREVERYWVNKPYAFVIIFHSEKENEKKYYAVEPHLNPIEEELRDFLGGKLRTAIKYSDDGIKHTADLDGRREVIEEETRRLLKRYDLFEKSSGKTTKGIIESLRTLLEDEDETPTTADLYLEGTAARPEPAILEDDPDTLTEYQVEKLLYLLKRNFLGYERIDPIKHDINVEDISCDGYNSPVFVYHSGYEQVISNIYHGESELDDFVVKLAQRSGKGISKRLPQVDTTLPDGSRAQLTLGKEVSDHGTNYTIRQFKDVPFTPVDLINWNTFSLDEMAYLWLAIENHKSLIFAGGTASGKTTSLNAVSLFIPSNTKIVSIEDTREVELPQRNWIASVTRPSFADDDQGDVDEFDLLRAALRQRPDYLVMGEIRGEEGRTLFQVMSTGHTTYTTFHADSVDEVLKRFTTDPINVSKTMFTALDLVSIQTQTRVQGQKVRRNKSLTEINHYEAEHDEINVQDVYQWQAETDEYLKMGDSNTLEEIKFDRGWNDEKLRTELFKRQVILAYLIKNGLNTYSEVAATVQAFINDQETILTLIANSQLENSLEDLQEMESVLIDVDPEKEELVPRPDSTTETYNLSTDILERAEESLFEEYRGQVPSGLASALGDVEQADPIEVDRADVDDFDFGGEVDEDVSDDEWDLGDGSTEFAFDSGDGPAWLNDDGDFATADASDGTAAEASSTPADSTSEAPTASASAPELEAGPAETSTAVPDESTSSRSTDEVQPATGSDETASEASQPAPDSGPEDGEEVTAQQADSGTAAAADHDTSGKPSSAAGTSAEADASAATDTSTTTDTSATAETSTTADSSATADTSVTSSTSTATPPETADEGDGTLEGLFSDMGSTLERLEEGPSTETRTETHSKPGPDTSGFDAMFPDRDLDSIFGSGPVADDVDSSSNDAGSDADGSSDDTPAEAPQGSIFDEDDGSIFDDENQTTGAGAGDGPADSSTGTDTVDSNDGNGSIFGDDGGDSIFSDDDDDASDGIDGSVSGSIFSEDGDDEAADDDAEADDA